MPFVRRAPAASSSSASPAAAPPTELRGVRPSPSGQKLVSSGVGSLDDILGGGLPLSTSLLLLAPDVHTQWSRLVARHIASAGLIDGQNVVIIGNRSWADGLPWLDPRSDGSESEGEAEGNTGRQREEKIAWRYDRMGRFRTTVGSSRIAANTTIPAHIRAELEKEGRLTYIDPGDGLASVISILSNIKCTQATRIIIPDLGGLELPLSQVEINRVLYTLRHVLRSLPAIGVVTLPPKFDKPSHLADAVLTLQGFGGAPGLAKAYYPSHGLITLHKLYAGNDLLAPALRYSQLLGVASGAGEQNLGFRLKRKRWVVESVHLGIEGGSNERRTEPVAKPKAKIEEGPTEGIERPAKEGQAEGVERVTPKEEAETAGKTTMKKKRPSVRFGDVDEHSTAKNHSTTHQHSEESHVRFANADEHAPTAKDHSISHAAHAPSRVRFGDDVEIEHQTAQDHSKVHKPHVHFGEVGGEHTTAIDHSTSHGHGHGHDHSHAPRVEIRHDRPDLYEF